MGSASRISPPEERIFSRTGLLARLKWQGRDCRFEDKLLLPATRLPNHPGLRRAVESLRTGRPGEHWLRRFAAGELVPARDPALRLRLPIGQFQATTGDAPAFGRFYPRSCLGDMSLPPSSQNRFRITAIDEAGLCADFNHPLATQDIDLQLVVQAGAPGALADRTNTWRCWLDGPGMQDRLPSGETDFLTGNPFARLDEDDDSAFFAEPSLEPYWSRPALERVSSLYRRLIPPGQRVLDLMAGVHSPLQEAGIGSLRISCAGLNAIELRHNPVCCERYPLNVNRDLPLPWPDQHFDTVLIHAAIEYAIRPLDLLSDIHRLLRPDGLLIISYSNHWVEDKVIRIWTRLHDFERGGLILSWLRRQGGFGQFGACSLRNLLRSDQEPVFAVWASKC